METSSSSHSPSYSTICNALTSEEDTPCSSCSSFNLLEFELRQGSEVIYDEEEGEKIIKYPFHSLSFPILCKQDSLVQVTHESFPIYPSLDAQFE